MNSRRIVIAILTGALLLSGCTSAKEIPEESRNNGGNGAQVSTSQGTVGSSASGAAAASVSTLDVSDMFSNRDLKVEYDEAECTLITLSGSSASCDDSAAVTIDGNTVIIQKDGSYILRGEWKGSVRVEAPKDAKVQLILDGAEITSDGTAAIYAKKADKVFITLAENSSNQITNGGDFQAIDDNNIDGAIFSKCDLTLNGKGSLTLRSEKGHGIVSKDDLKITSGTYVITAGDHGISGKDSIRIADGNLTITCEQDGLHSGNDEDADKGYVYVAGGNITINAKDDGIHGETKVVIADGVINVEKSYEGIEAAIVEIAGGDVSVVASDDGLNASSGKSKDVYLLISGGRLVVDAQGDGLDSNGDLYVTGGEIYVSGPESSRDGALDYETKGEITGGSVIAIGSTGMAMNFSSATQGSALINTTSTHGAGELIQLKDSEGNVLISFTSTKKFASVVVSSPQMKQGETYTLVIGSEVQTFTLDELIYGQSFGFGGKGGHGGFGGPGGRMDGQDGNFEGRPGGGKGGFQMPGDQDGDKEGTLQWPEGFDGTFEGMPQWPKGFDGTFEGMPQPPEGFDGNHGGTLQWPEGFDGTFEGMPQWPKGFDGNFEGMPQPPDGEKEGFGGKGQKQDGNMQKNRGNGNKESSDERD